MDEVTSLTREEIDRWRGMGKVITLDGVPLHVVHPLDQEGCWILVHVRVGRHTVASRWGRLAMAPLLLGGCRKAGLQRLLLTAGKVYIVSLMSMQQNKSTKQAPLASRL